MSNETDYTPSTGFVEQTIASCAANILDIPTELTPLCSPSSPPPSEPNSLSIAPVLAVLAYFVYVIYPSADAHCQQCVSADEYCNIGK